ncbi:MAG: replication factor C large subunit [Candidatus ainarchaeum sp.]|nr:replication factor C large subunit [Candidatus ainarchaeum sp.]
MDDTQLLIDKYFPKNFKEFIGNTEIVEDAQKWAENWKNNIFQKPLFFFGPPGIGKTVLAYLIAKSFGWQVFEMNSSDLRNKERIEKIVGSAAENTSLFGSKRLILIDEIDSLQAIDRGGVTAIVSIIKSSNNPIILTANEIYSDKKLLPLRTTTQLKEFKKINYLSIAKKLREICDLEKISYDSEAIKELAKNSGGDFRSALLDIQNIIDDISIENVKNLFPRQRKEKIFPLMTKIFKGHNMKEIQEMVNNSEVSPDLLVRWVEENIPRQFDLKDTAKAFSVLSRGDIFKGRIFLRQHYSFLKYVFFLSTVGVGLSRTKDYSGWNPFQFPNLLSSLSSTTSTRNLRTSLAKKIGSKTHTSIKEGMRDIPFIQILLENKKIAPEIINFFKFDEKEIAFLLNTKNTKKVILLKEKSDEIEKQKIFFAQNKKQSSLFC